MEWQSRRITKPKSLARALQQARQSRVVGSMERGDSREPLGNGNGPPVDRLRVADNSGYRSESRRHA